MTIPNQMILKLAEEIEDAELLSYGRRHYPPPEPECSLASACSLSLANPVKDAQERVAERKQRYWEMRREKTQANRKRQKEIRKMIWISNPMSSAIRKLTEELKAMNEEKKVADAAEWGAYLEEDPEMKKYLGEYL